VDIGLFLSSESSYRESGYVAMSRGRLTNYLYALGGENHRWEIGHGRDGVIPPDVYEQLGVAMTRSKAQALASEHLPCLAVRNVETARQLWEARWELGKRLAKSAPPDRIHDLDVARIALGEAGSRRDASAEARDHAVGRLERARTEAIHHRRRAVARAEADLARRTEHLAGTESVLAGAENRVDRLEQGASRRAEWIERNRSEIAAYRLMGARLAEWDALVGRSVGYARPAYITDHIGPQPANHTRARLWESAAGAIEGYRRRWGIDDTRHALGVEPEPGSQYDDRARAERAAEAFGEAVRSRERDAGREHGLELELTA
jgi:hypothetical protein